MNLNFSRSFRILFSHPSRRSMDHARVRAQRGERACFFCSPADKPTFRSIAHLIPMALGGERLTTPLECDNHNAWFARAIDDDFLKALAPFRMTHQATGYKGVCTLKRNKSGAKIKCVDHTGTVLIVDAANDSVMVDDLSDFDSGVVKLRVPVQKHRPIAIPKALARMAVLAAPELRAPDYAHVRDWLLGERTLLPTLYLTALAPTANRDVTLQVLEYTGEAAEGWARHLVCLWFDRRIYVYHLPRATHALPAVFPMPSMHPDGVIPWEGVGVTSEEAVPGHDWCVTLQIVGDETVTTGDGVELTGEAARAHVRAILERRLARMSGSEGVT